MLLSKLVGERTKTNPSDATAVSHALLVRAGYMKLVSNGIWSLAMPAKRITKIIGKNPKTTPTKVWTVKIPATKK